MQDRTGGLLPRREFEGFVQRHEDDPNAHAAERHRQNDDLAARFLSIEAAVTRMDRFQQRLMGGFLVLAALLGSGVVAGLIELQVHK